MNRRSAQILRRIRALLYCLGACAVIACTSVPEDRASSSSTEVKENTSLVEQAQSAYTAEDWPLTAQLYTKLLKDAPGNARYWYRVAVAQRYLGQYDAALASLDKGAANGLPPSYADYERAKVAATQNRNDDAIALLQTAAAAGLSGKERVLQNEQLALLAGSAGFDEVLDVLDANANPCRDSAYHEFDFWLGSWEVKTAAGTVAGVNKISARESGCMLLEEWTGATGSTGTSMNYYDAIAKEWTQVWISPGLQLKITGGLENGSMVLSGKAHYVQTGVTSPFRGRWTPLDDGRVRQFFEQMDVEGNWSPWFEGFYTRTNPEAAAN